MACSFSVKVLKPKQESGNSNIEAMNADVVGIWTATAQEIPAFLGVNEGTVLAEQAHALGFETESWVIDPGLAPHLRDWVGQANVEMIEFYFSDRTSAELFLKSVSSPSVVAKIEEIPDQDWNAEWKASFQGIDVAPYFSVLPPHLKGAKSEFPILWINPGAGFGTGTHETTRGCLQFLGAEGSLQGKTVLDFGSGSGILAIAAAVNGAQVTAVEIDPLANENAAENARLNQVEDRVQIQEALPNGKVFDIILANILRPILLEFADALCQRSRAGTKFIFSGLVAEDVEQVLQGYAGKISISKPEIHALNEWRAISFNRIA